MRFVAWSTLLLNASICYPEEVNPSDWHMYCAYYFNQRFNLHFISNCFIPLVSQDLLLRMLRNISFLGFLFSRLEYYNLQSIYQTRNLQISSIPTADISLTFSFISLLKSYDEKQIREISLHSTSTIV